MSKRVLLKIKREDNLYNVWDYSGPSTECIAYGVSEEDANKHMKKAGEEPTDEATLFRKD